MKNTLFKNLFLLLSTLIILLLSFGCNQKEEVQLTFAFGPDDTGSIQHLIDEFNAKNQGEIEVKWQQGSRSSDEFFREIQADFSSDKPSIDVFGADVVWTGMLGQENQVLDLSQQFYQDYHPETFLKPAMKSAVYNFRTYGVPWFTDAAMLFYRKDLLDKHGFQAPETFLELTVIAKTIMEKENMPYGYVFQADNYEGGVATACEFVWNAGGEIVMDDLSLAGELDENYMTPTIITVDSKSSEVGFRAARELIEDGVTPVEVADYREQEALGVFMDGQAVFMRGWPGMYGLFDKAVSIVKTSQVGVHHLPVMFENAEPYSCLGGWNLMISSDVSPAEKEAAWKFIRYLTDAPQQRYRAMKSGTLPSLKSLYFDEELIAEMPVIKLGREEIRNAKSRPVSPYYMGYSPEISRTFQQTLKGEVLPEYAVSSLQEFLEDIQLENMVVEQ